MTEYVTCTPHRANARFHISFDDFLDFCDDDAICANGLRVFEVMTNDAIKYLRYRHHIPSTHLPSEDDLWLEVSCRDLEWWSVSVRRKSAYARAILPYHEKHPTLIQRGFVRSRFVARRDETRPLFDEHGKRVKFPSPKRPVLHDSHGNYFVVDDAGGGYEVDGVQYAAAESGYTKVIRQFLYEIDAVNTAIAGLDGNPPPKPFPRWRSLASGEKREKSEQSRETTNLPESSLPSANDSAAAAAQRGTLPTTAKHGSFTYHDNTMVSPMSTKNAPHSAPSQNFNAPTQWTAPSTNGQPRPATDGSVHRRSNASANGCNKNQKESKNLQKISKKDSAPLGAFSLLSDLLDFNDFADLRTAPWCPETVLALVSRVLPVPNFEEIEASGDSAAIEAFCEDWLRPTERLMHRLDALGPALAWERIDWQSRYMTQENSPSWWRPGPVGNHRANDAPITMRHVADNHETQFNDLRKKGWQPSDTTPYDGPPESWLGNATPPSPGADEGYAPERGMVRILADRLAACIMREHPGIIVSNVEIGIPGRFAIGVLVDDEQWHDFEDAASYFDADEKTWALIEQAAEYGRRHGAAMMA